MSFKLTGDKYDEISIIKRRRVEELLGSNIPKDEALLTKNGRYVCLVCRSLPLFDTVAMLTIHRKGKTHMISANRKYAEDQERRDEVNKRIQKGDIREDSLPKPLLEQTRAATERVLTSSSPYSAIVTRKRRNPPEEGKDVAGTSSRGYFFTVSTTTKLPPDADRSHARHVTEDSADEVESVEPHIPEWKEFEYVQPWNAGLSRGKCGMDKRKSGHVCKNTSTQTSKNAEDNLTALYVKRSGWKLAPSGEWVKDPDAEFDSESDEESEAKQDTNSCT